MMKEKFLALMLAAALPMLAQPALSDVNRGTTGPHFDTLGSTGIYGYFFVENYQTVCSEEDVDWECAGGFSSAHITLDPCDTTQIIIENNGVYLATFAVQEGSEGPTQFGLYLNDELVPGSVYAAAGNIDQVNGQVIFRVLESFSTLELVNLSTNEATLENDVGAGIDCLKNVSASIFIQRIADLDQPFNDE